MVVDVTAPRKKYALLKWSRRWNKRNPTKRVEKPRGFSPESKRIGAPAREFVRRMQRVTGMPVTGQFDEATMRRMFPPSLRGIVMAKAHGQLGVHEWPAGSNSGPVRKYLEAASYPWAGPWCAAFVSWVLLKVGFKRAALPPNPASVESWLDHARAHGCTKPVEKSLRGDLWVWNVGGNPHGHIGFCDDTNPRDVAAYGLDGNVGDYGGEVTQVQRTSGQITACIDLVKLSRLP
jgi:hypothetical protein